MLIIPIRQVDIRLLPCDTESAMARYSSVLDLIGNTPIVEVSQLSPNPNVRIFAKLESQNPSGSVKDRIAKAMLDEAEADGTLRPGQIILEPSSGNTGIALAMICQQRGYKLKVVLPENVSIERRQLLQVWGAQVISSPGSQGSNGAVRLAQELAMDHPEWAFLYQYGNEANPTAHYTTTGPEILADVPEITHFVAGLGTSGTLVGVGTYLKEQKPEVKVLAVEPPAGEQVDGLRSLDDGFIPPVFDKWGGLELLDGKRIVRPIESIEYTRRLASEAGIFAGLSSGAALAGAVRVAERVPDGEEAVVVFVVSDGGWKYLSTGAWTDDIDEVAARANEIVYF
jgi:cysteine synthase